MRRSRSSFPILDAHNDTLILREVRGDPLDFADGDPAYQVDLPRLRQGEMSALFAMVGDRDLYQSLRLIDAVYAMAARHPQDFALCLSAKEVRRAHRAGQIGLIMSIEGQSMFAERLENLRNWHRLGVRVASLTHGEGRRNSPHALQIDASYFGYLEPAAREVCRRNSKGLTSFARESLREMARLGMVCDLAHANDKTFWETLEYTDGPVCYTHGNCYALCPHTRNCTDEMLKALASKGGVIGLCFYGAFVDRQQPTLDRLVDHFLHALEVMGEDHVGIGTDFDGIGLHEVPVIPQVSSLPCLWEKLSERGVPWRAFPKIASENFLRLLP